MNKKNEPVCSAAQTGGIVLFAKQPGQTSFSSLFTIKHALVTQKVGHTGTLDSFASGLLVVCVGPLTRVVSRITEFDKSYDAVISFGRETDTLEWTGTTVREAQLPTREAVQNAVETFRGTIMQTPPVYSALHVDGRRASDLARSGASVSLPAREVTIYNSEIKEWQIAAGGGVEAVLVSFTVSKGTYIRSIARDIGIRCGSAAHLAGLRRQTVGSFRLADAVGAEMLAPFTIQNVYAVIAAQKAAEKSALLNESAVPSFVPQQTAGSLLPSSQVRRNKRSGASYDTAAEQTLQQEVRQKIRAMTEPVARECGFGCAHLNAGLEHDFRNGRTLSSGMFAEKITGNIQTAVFSAAGIFLGMVESSDNAIRYDFVLDL